MSRGTRLELHSILADLLGSRNVYFQPPGTVEMKYPCIVYMRSLVDTKYADDGLYNSRNCYSVAVIGPDPDSGIPEKMMKLPFCRFDRHYTASNLNHDIYTLYY